MSMAMTKLKMTKEVNLQRSASAPVGMVAVVSMNTIWKKNIAATAGVESEAGQAEQAERLAEERDRELLRERGVAAEGGQGADAAHLQPEADQVEADDADGVDEEVHPHGVRHVLGAGE